jgi:hypothetical protein
MALDLREGTLAGIAAFYAIVNIPKSWLPSAFLEMCRVLKPGGLLLLAFHIGNKMPHEDELCGRSISGFSSSSSHWKSAGIWKVRSLSLRRSSSGSPIQQRWSTKAEGPTSSRGSRTSVAHTVGRHNEIRNDRTLIAAYANNRRQSEKNSCEIRNRDRVFLCRTNRTSITCGVPAGYLQERQAFCCAACRCVVFSVQFQRIFLQIGHGHRCGWCPPSLSSKRSIRTRCIGPCRTSGELVGASH